MSWFFVFRIFFYFVNHLIQVLSELEGVWRVDGPVADAESLEVDLEVGRLVLVVDLLADGRHVLTLGAWNKLTSGHGM